MTDWIFLPFPENRFWQDIVCMKCQILFSEKKTPQKYIMYPQFVICWISPEVQSYNWFAALCVYLISNFWFCLFSFGLPFLFIFCLLHLYAMFSCIIYNIGLNYLCDLETLSIGVKIPPVEKMGMQTRQYGKKCQNSRQNGNRQNRNRQNGNKS